MQPLKQRQGVHPAALRESSHTRVCHRCLVADHAGICSSCQLSTLGQAKPSYLRPPQLLACSLSYCCALTSACLGSVTLHMHTLGSATLCTCLHGSCWARSVLARQQESFLRRQSTTMITAHMKHLMLQLHTDWRSAMQYMQGRNPAYRVGLASAHTVICDNSRQ